MLTRRSGIVDILGDKKIIIIIILVTPLRGKLTCPYCFSLFTHLTEERKCLRKASRFLFGHIISDSGGAREPKLHYLSSPIIPKSKIIIGLLAISELISDKNPDFCVLVFFSTEKRVG